MSTFLLCFFLLQRPDKPKFHVPAEVQDVIDSGLRYLSRSQRADGKIGGRSYITAVTALSGMAFLSQGSTGKGGKYKDEVKKCVGYVLNSQKASGMIAGPDHHQIYEHCFALLFLCEAYGESGDDGARIRVAIRRGVDLLLRGQNKRSGGWRYDIPSRDEDVSITVAVIMALRAARNTGFRVPFRSMERGVEYLKTCQSPDGSFGYTAMDSNWNTGATRTAACLAAFYSAGEYNGKHVKRALRHLKLHKPGGKREYNMYYYYKNYYAAAAMKQNREDWEWWYELISNDLVKKNKKGKWTSSSYGSEYGTAMACIILQLPNDYLPIFQD